MSQVDLHVHSTASDGRFSPAEIVRRAAELGLTVIALTDHDTVAGVDTALATAGDLPGLRVIPGVEISTDVPDGEVHLLGYFLDHTDRQLIAALERFRGSRQERARRMVAKLGNLGLDIDWARVQAIAGDGALGRPHIAQAMLEKGYVASFGEAFTRYIGHGGPAYVERGKMTPVQSVELVLRARGIPVLAHPLTASDPEALIIELKQAGLVGLEVYYDSYTADEVSQLLGLARRYGLIATGGSDYHGLDAGTETMLGGADVPLEAAERLLTLLEQQG